MKVSYKILLQICYEFLCGGSMFWEDEEDEFEVNDDNDEDDDYEDDDY